MNWGKLTRCLPESLDASFAARPNLLGAIKNIVWLFFDKAIRILGGIIVGAWVARYLGPQEYGQLIYVLTYIGFFAAFVSMGLNGPVVRNIVYSPDNKFELLSSAFSIQMLSGLIFYLLALFVAIIINLDDKQAIVFIAIYGVSLIFKSSDVIKYYFESQVASKYVVISDNTIFFTTSIAKVVLISLELSLKWFVWLLTLEAAFYATALFLTLRLRSIEKMKFLPSLKTIKKLTKESGPIAIASIFVALNLNADKIILVQFFPSAELGIYAAASIIVVTWFFVPLSIGGTVAPRLNIIYNDNIKNYEKYVAKLYLYVTTGSILIALLVSLFGNYLISILYGPQYERSSEVLVVLIWSIVFISIVSIRGRLLVIEEKNNMIPTLTFYGAVVNLVMSFILVPKYGANGAAVAFVSSWFVSALIAPLFHSQIRNHALIALCIAKRN